MKRMMILIEGLNSCKEGMWLAETEVILQAIYIISFCKHKLAGLLLFNTFTTALLPDCIGPLHLIVLQP